MSPFRFFAQGVLFLSYLTVSFRAFVVLWNDHPLLAVAVTLMCFGCCAGLVDDVIEKTFPK